MGFSLPEGRSVSVGGPEGGRTGGTGGSFAVFAGAETDGVAFRRDFSDGEPGGLAERIQMGDPDRQSVDRAAQARIPPGGGGGKPSCHR